MKTERSVVIFSGYNFRAIIAFMRFADSQRIPFHIVARSKDDPIFLTIYKNRVLIVRDSESISLQLFEKISEKMNDSLDSVILPSTEFLNRFLIEHTIALISLGFSIPLVEKELYTTISNKKSFGELCLRYDINVPKTISGNSLYFPYVAKPLVYKSSECERYLAPYIIHNEIEFDSFSKLENLNDFYFQEFVNGESHYLLYHVSKTGEVESFGQENLMQQPNGKSILAARYSNIHNEAISNDYIRMLQLEGFYGLIMIEVKKNEDEYYMIEANPRLWGPSQFFLDSGSGIFHRFAKDCGFKVSDQGDLKKNKKYFWSGGFMGLEGKADFHAFTDSAFSIEYASFIKSDVFLREDTLNYFINEIKN